MDFISPQSLDLISRLLNTIRRRPIPYDEIGDHPFGKSLIVKRRIQQKTANPRAIHERDISKVALGMEIVGLINELIYSMKPDGEVDISKPEWEHYLLLSSLIFERAQHIKIEAHLGIRTTKFYEVRRQAEHGLALRLQDLENKEVNRSYEVRQNLRKSSFYYNEFVRRYDPNKKKYYDEWIVRDLLTRPGRIITLFGPPGVGKTSLAYNVAVQFVENGFSDAVIWVSAKEEIYLPLQHRSRKITSAVTTFDAILNTIGRELGNREILNQPTMQKIAIVNELFKERMVLLIIDNLETLTEDTLHSVEDFLSDLPPFSKVIVTSRRTLLAPEKPVHLDRMLDKEAKRLIHSTLKILQIPKMLTDEAQDEIIRIADGNPLVIQNLIGFIRREGDLAELKKFDQAKVHKYMYEELYRNLLHTDERKILHALSIVPEALSLSALSSTTGLKHSQIVVHLQDLRTDALIRHIDANNEYFHLLPLARQFLKTISLDFVVENKPLHKYLNDAYRLLAQHYITELKSLRDIDQRIDYQLLERNNILQVMLWCYSDKQWRLLIELFDLVSLPFGVLGYLRDRIIWGERVRLACAKNEEAKLWYEVYDIAWSHLRLGEIDDAKKILDNALQIAEAKGYKRVEAAALRCYGLLAREQKKYRLGMKFLKRSLRIWQILESEEWVVSTRASLGRLYLTMGNISDAKDELMYAYANRDKIGHSGERADAFSDLAVVVALQGEHKQAQKLIRESFEISSKITPPAPAHAHVQACRARIEHIRGNKSKAHKLYLEALEIYRLVGMENFSHARFAQLALDNI